MTNPTDRLLDESGELGRLIRRVRQRLRDGGPEVNSALLIAYLDGRLPPEQESLVRRAVASWKSWHDEYWALRDAFPEPSVAAEGLGVSVGVSFVHLVANDLLALRSFLARTVNDLLGEMGGFVPAFRGVNPLSAHLEKLRPFVVERWWPKHRKKPGLLHDPQKLAASLADELMASDLDLPFPATLTAAVLVKAGLENLFGPLPTDMKGD